MADCPVCGFPGTPQNDDAFYCRYRALTPEKKKALRKMAAVVVDGDQRNEFEPPDPAPAHKKCNEL